MRYARIAEGIVAEIIELPADVELKDAFHESIVTMCVEASDDVEPGWIYDGEVFAPPLAPPAPDLDGVKAEAVRTMIAYADSITARITSRYPAAEVASWTVQEIEARAVLDGGGAEAAPLLSLSAPASGMSLTEFAQLVIDNAAFYRHVIAAVQAVRWATEEAINAADSPEAVADALENARVIAEAKADELGLGGR